MYRRGGSAEKKGRINNGREGMMERVNKKVEITSGREKDAVAVTLNRQFIYFRGSKRVRETLFDLEVVVVGCIFFLFFFLFFLFFFPLDEFPHAFLFCRFRGFSQPVRCHRTRNTRSRICRVVWIM